MISFKISGSWQKTDQFLLALSTDKIYSTLDKWGRVGVAALANATPVESGLTAASWNYKVQKTRGSYSILWTNSHVEDGRPIAILLQYGHGTGTGGYVSGRDYINPAIRPIFDQISDEVWKAVTSA